MSIRFCIVSTARSASWIRSDRDLFQRFAGEGIVSYLRAGKARRSIANKIGLPTRVLCSTTMLEVDAFLSAGEGVFPAFFGLEMRHFLPVVIALQCAHLATASTLPLTGKDIVLMLRMGYSTEDVVRDLEAKHFVGPLDANSEAQIRDLNGSSKLLDTLKSGQLNATKEEVAQAEQKSAATSAEAEGQQQPASQSGGVGKHRSGPSQNRKAKPDPDKSQTVDLEIGQPLNLREFNGPNVRLIVNGIEMSEIVITVVHPRQMRIDGRNVSSGYDLSAAPGQTSIRIKRENNSLVYRWGRTKVVYLDAIDTPQNHVRLGVIPE
jgi:hypothetical protein